jgi:ubiquinone/menaquinone biosynthesis C-methylase UbiE
MDTRLYPKHGNNWNDELFRQRLLQHIGPATRCLDFGCGRGNVKQMNFKGIAGWIAGVDPEKAVFENPYIDDGQVLDLEKMHIPYPDASFDLVFADNVMEHVVDPPTTLAEIRRVLKPGGHPLAKTPNKWHYMPIIARLTPTGFHRFYNRLRGREVIDTFPTQYRSNTPGDVRRIAEASGFAVKRIDFIEGRPEYLRIFALTYLVGWLYERAVNAVPALARLRCVMVFELERVK